MQFPLVAAGRNWASVWFTHLNCCHGSQGWRRALLLWERTSKRAFWVCWVEKTLRYVCLALFLQFSVCVRALVYMCVCVSLTVWCPRAAMMSASVWETLPRLPLVLCLRFLGARHSSHILCWLTTPPSPWLLAKLLPRWPPDAALELLGSKLWTSHPSPNTVFRNSASPLSMLERQRQTQKKTDSEAGEHRGGLKIIACMIKYALHCLFQLCQQYECISITAHAQTHAHSI